MDKGPGATSYGRNTSGVALFSILGGGSFVASIAAVVMGEYGKGMLASVTLLYSLAALRRLWRMPYLTIDREGISVLDLSERNWLSLVPNPNQPPRLVRWSEIREVQRQGFSAMILVLEREQIRIDLGNLSRQEREEIRLILSTRTKA